MKARRFLIGYKTHISAEMKKTVWGRRNWLARGHLQFRDDDYCELMTEAEARVALEWTNKGGVIYELVEKQVK